MALIKCPECMHMISEYADKCIYCGCPMSIIKSMAKDKVKKSISKTRKIQNVDKKTEKKVVIKPTSFIEQLTNSEKTLLEAFSTLIKEKIPAIKTKDSVYTYGFKVANEVNSLCWFAKKEDGRLVLKYYNDPIQRNTYTELRIDSLAADSSACKKSLYSLQNLL